MGLIDRVTRVFGGRRTQPEQTTSDDIPARAMGPMDLAERMRADQDRQSIIQTCRKMYKSDPRAEGVIRTLARDAVMGGFQVVCAGASAQDRKAKEVAAELIKRLKLIKRLDDWVRLTLRDGDSFIELGVNDRLEIVDATRKPALQVRRNGNDADRFDDPTRAFWMAEELWTAPEPPSHAIWFAEWQIVHARWGSDEGARYGRPLFAPATGSWKRITEGEIDVAVRRKTRSGVKYVHRFPDGTPEAVIRAYKALNQDSLDNPTAAIADFFGTVDINLLQGDATLGNIDDVMHHIRTWWLASPVPMSILGYGQDLNRDVLEKQADQYGRALEGVTEWVADQFVEPLLERQWLLAGILPEGLDYELQWKSKESLSAVDLRDVADAALRLKALGLPDEVLLNLLMKFLPGVDLTPDVLRTNPAPPADADARQATAERLAAVANRFMV